MRLHAPSTLSSHRCGTEFDDLAVARHRWFGFVSTWALAPFIVHPLNGSSTEDAALRALYTFPE